MSDGTAIEWTDATWNPITGCSVHSPGCTNCYAMKLAGTRMKHHWSRKGLTIDTKAGPVWTGEVRFNEEWLTQPLQWKRPRMIFVCAHADLFHESVPDEWIDRIFAVMALCPQHIFQVLTKRADRMHEYQTALMDGSRHVLCAMSDLGAGNTAANAAALWGEDARQPLPNVWLGVSVEDQQRADERIPDLLATPAAVRWLSCEPLLEAVNIDLLPDYRHARDCAYVTTDGPAGCTCSAATGGIDWVVAGGESGPDARPIHPDWARSLRDQCAAAGVPFLFKQWGEWRIADMLLRSPIERRHWQGLDLWRVGKKAAGRLLDGVEHNGFPV
jgi:Bacteriophage protein gp37